MVTCHLNHYAGITGLGIPTDAMGRCEVTQRSSLRLDGPEEETNIGKMIAREGEL